MTVPNDTPIHIQPTRLTVVVRIDQEIVFFRPDDCDAKMVSNLTNTQNEIVKTLLRGALSQMEEDST